MVAEGKLAGDSASGGGEANMAIGEYPNQAIFLKPAEGHGDGRRGDPEPVGEAGGDDPFSFRFSLEDGFEVILFGDGDHCRDYTRVKRG